MFCVTGVLVGTIFLTSVFVQTVLALQRPAGPGWPSCRSRS